MKRRGIAAALIATLVVALTGCLRYSGVYNIQSNGTVSGQIYTALKEGYQDDSKPYHGTNAGDIAAHFQNATISEMMNPPWYGYIITFTDEPLSTFAAVPSEAWQVQITKSGNVYTVNGYNTDQADDNTRNAIKNNDGFVSLQVSFPGTVKDPGNSKDSGELNGVGYVVWDLVNMTGTPHATGNGGLILLYPGIHFNPIQPTAAPATTPAPPANPPKTTPQPVVTVVVTPSPKASPSASPSPSPTPTAMAAGSSGGSSGIPPWVWIVMGGLLAALAGLGGFMAANRAKVPTPAVAGGAATDAGPADAPSAGDAKPDDT